jgi:hypothetical protein
MRFLVIIKIRGYEFIGNYSPNIIGQELSIEIIMHSEFIYNLEFEC